MNIHRTAVSSPAKPPNTPKAESSKTISIPVPSISLDTVGKAVKSTVRLIPGTLNVALNSPNLVVTPILNAYDPATTNRDQIFYERWGNVLGSTAIGTAAGVVTSAAIGQSLAAGGGIGAAAGLAIGGGRVLISAMINEPPSYNRYEPAKYPSMGYDAQAAKNKFGYDAYGTAKALRQSYAAGFGEAYEDGAKLGDAVTSTVAQSGNFVRGLLNLPRAEG